MAENLASRYVHVYNGAEALSKCRSGTLAFVASAVATMVELVKEASARIRARGRMAIRMPGSSETASDLKDLAVRRNPNVWKSVGEVRKGLGACAGLTGGLVLGARGVSPAKWGRY